VEGSISSTKKGIIIKQKHIKYYSKSLKINNTEKVKKNKFYQIENFTLFKTKNSPMDIIKEII